MPVVRDIWRKTIKYYSVEEKIQIIMSGLCREGSVSTLCCHVDIAEGLYYSYTIEFSEVGKKRLVSNTELPGLRAVERVAI